ncbi:hypothetical protein ACP4OV_013320 [Aristida adscensionis]
MDASADQGHQKNHAAAAVCDGSSSNGTTGKPSWPDLYAGAVAQRALSGSSRCRGSGAPAPRRVVGKDCKPPPSRLSKMSGAGAGAAETTSSFGTNR